MSERAGWPVALALAAGACAAQLPQPTAATLEVAQSRRADASLDQLREGRALYVRNCSGCHDLLLPHTQVPERWSTFIQQMRRDEEVTLSDRDAELIEQYLYATSHIARAEEPSAKAEP